ncbi:MAG: hypothetical protein M3O46_18865, partial [Myxococcota bacterium]|nr:hypothetical protein [Myxococcota bacterium]
MEIRRLGQWVSLLAMACFGGSVVSACGSSEGKSVFDSGVGRFDASLGADDSVPVGNDDAGNVINTGDSSFACVPKSCAALGLTCGMNGDGCDGVIDCGSCPAGQFCGGGGYSKCGTGMDGGTNSDGGSSCQPVTCAALGYNCGKTGDGCGTVLDCGSCVSPQYCGGGGFNTCGTGTPDGGPPCTPKTCATLNYNCGAAGDGCGGALQCGTCTPPQFCGGGGYDTCGGMVPPVLPDGAPGLPCTPLTCAALGFNCGPAGDGCGGRLDCGTCNGTDICGGAGKPGVCGGSAPCTNLCQQQMKCDGGAPTTITGTIFAGASPWTGLPPDPVPNVLVFVRNAPLQPFTPGASCRQCGADVSGAPLVSTYTDFDGTFTLTNVPAGTNIPLVIQLGRWRREFKLTIPACATTPIGALNLPRNQSEGNLPLTAISTGNVDPLECVLMKMGVDQAEFTPDSAAGGTGRVQIYGGGPLQGGASKHGPGATAGAGTRQEASLLDSPGGTFMAYDQLMLPCWGSPTPKTGAELANLITYSDSGGHFFATHYSYSWLFGNGEFNNVAQWNPDYNNPGTVTWALNVSTIVPPSPPAPHVGTFAKWLNLTQSLSNFGATVPANPQVAITNPRHDANVVANGSVDWIDGTDPVHNNAMLEHFTFNTPVGVASQCGHDIFSDFHVAGIANGPNTNGQVFPAECTTTFTPQEKILEFMIWDLASCVPPPPSPSCTPIDCAAQNISCGPAGDGCGGSLNCGPCPPGQQCGGNGVYGKCIPIPEGGTCLPQTCADRGVNCGPLGNGCGGSLDC